MTQPYDLHNERLAASRGSTSAKTRQVLPNPRERIRERRDLPTVLERIEEVCQQEPERVAVRQGSDELSYRELWRRTLAVARALHEGGLQRGDVVQEPRLGRGDGGSAAGWGCLLLAGPGPSESRQRRLVEAGSALPKVSSTDSAYVFFTSGSSGAPKGVLGSHKGLSHFVRNMSTTLGHSRAAFSEPRLWWGDS